MLRSKPSWMQRGCETPSKTTCWGKESYHLLSIEKIVTTNCLTRRVPWVRWNQHLRQLSLNSSARGSRKACCLTNSLENFTSSAEKCSVQCILSWVSRIHLRKRRRNSWSRIMCHSAIISHHLSIRTNWTSCCQRSHWWNFVGRASTRS